MEKTKLRIGEITENRELIYANKANNGYVHWEKVKFSDLPNDELTAEDLKRFGINIDHTITLSYEKEI